MAGRNGKCFHTVERHGKGIAHANHLPTVWGQCPRSNTSWEPLWLTPVGIRHKGDQCIGGTLPSLNPHPCAPRENWMASTRSTSAPGSGNCTGSNFPPSTGTRCTLKWSRSAPLVRNIHLPSGLNWGFIAPKFSSSFRSEPAAKSRTKVPSSSTPDPLGRTRAAYRPSGEISVTTPSATRVSSPPRVGTQYDVNPFSDWRLKYRRRPSALKQAGHSLAG